MYLTVSREPRMLRPCRASATHRLSSASCPFCAVAGAEAGPRTMAMQTNKFLFKEPTPRGVTITGPRSAPAAYRRRSAFNGQEYSVVGTGNVNFGATFLAFIVAEQ